MSKNNHVVPATPGFFLLQLTFKDEEDADEDIVGFVRLPIVAWSMDRDDKQSDYDCAYPITPEEIHLGEFDEWSIELPDGAVYVSGQPSLRFASVDSWYPNIRRATLKIRQERMKAGQMGGLPNDDPN